MELRSAAPAPAACGRARGHLGGFHCRSQAGRAPCAGRANLYWRFFLLLGRRLMCYAQRPQGGGGSGAPRDRHRAYCPRGGLPRAAPPCDRPRGGDAPWASPPPPRPEGPLIPGCAVLRMVRRAQGGGTSGSPRVVPRRGVPEGSAPRAVVLNRGEWRSRQGRGRSMQFGALTAA